MKRIRSYIVIAALLLLAALTASAQDVSKLKFPPLHPINVPQVERVTLDNGMRLYILQDPSLPVVHAAVRINCGSYLEPADKAGLASICGSVLRTGGTQKYTGDQIDEMLEGVGGAVETGIGIDGGSASMYVLQDNLDLGLEVLSQVLRYPVFNQDKIDLAKVGRRSSISRRNDDPSQIGVREFIKAIYGPESVFGRQPEYATIDNISREDLIAFHQAWFHPENIQLAVWGAVDKNQIVDKIKQYFGDWPKGTTPVPPLPKVEYAYAPKVHYAEKNDINQSSVLIGHIGGLMTDPDYAALIVMNNILGGSFSSRLFNNVRSKEGLAYSVSGSYTANIAYPGIFYSYASTKSETTAKAIKEIIAQIKSMQTVPPTPAEMDIGRSSYLNSFVFNFEDRSDVITRLMMYDYYGLPDDFLAKEKEHVEKVTPADVLNAAKNRLHSDDLQIVVVGKGTDFDTPLTQLGLGPVDTLDITIPKAEPKKQLSVTPENLQKGKELLGRAVGAHGGAAAFKKVKSVTVKETNTISTPQGDFPLTVESIFQYPDKSRYVITVMGQKMMNIRKGDAGWKSDRTGQMVAKSADEIAEEDLDLARSFVWLLATADSPDKQAVYDGPGELAGAKVEYVVLLGKDGKPITRLALDAQSGQLLSEEYWGQTFMGEGNIQEIFSDFKKIGTLLIPMKTEVNMNGQKVSTVAVSDYVVNGTIAPDAFEKPQS